MFQWYSVCFVGLNMCFVLLCLLECVFMVFLVYIHVLCSCEFFWLNNMFSDSAELVGVIWWDGYKNILMIL